jgi:tetratricopeptide (TPR) repeat protein
MIGRFLRILAASEEFPDATELADTLWLAGHLPELLGPPQSAPPTAAVPPADFAGPARSAIDHPPPGGSPAAPADAAAANLHLTTPEPAERTSRPAGPATLAGAPAVPAIREAVAVTRALRPLRARVKSRTYGIVDETATAERIADTGLWTPELLPDPERWLDLVLIIDKSASMVVWQHTVAEFQALLTQLAAFRAIGAVDMNSDEVPGIPDRRTESADRRLVLVLSDCVGRAWTDGNVLRSLEKIAGEGPVAIVQMLPQRLWTGCGLSFVPVRISAERRAGQPARLQAEQRTPDGAGSADGVPIPVLELDARWLAPWAAMVAEGTANPVPGMAVFTRSAPVPIQRHDAVTPYDRVTLFRSLASPMALRLATHLAAAPLSLPVMRLVQHVTLPQSRPADLAEVFLSGLLRRIAEPGQGQAEFEFYPGVREILLTGLQRAEALRVFRSVSGYIGERLGSPLEFSAVFARRPGSLASEHAHAEQGSLTVPFASLALTVLRSVGGRYREIADQLAEVPAEVAVPELLRIGRTGLRSGELTSGAFLPTSIPDRGVVSVPTPEEPGAPARPPVLWRGVPPKNPNFTGREDLLLALRSQLSSGLTALVPITLHGLGGVGKTQIAIEYVYRFDTDYDLICWISGEVPMQMRSDLAEIAPDLGIPAGGDLELKLAAVCDALRRGEPYNRWLLVVDNADVPEQLLPYLPQTGGHILITSRNQMWSGYAQTFQVAEFTRDESISLIQRRGRGISHADADRLADRLGDLPLAVEQAAAWQAESGMSVDRYLALLDERISTLLEENPPHGYSLNIVAAWSLAFEELHRRSPEAAALVQLCSFLGPEPIPYPLLWAFRHASDLPPDLERMFRDDVHFHRAVRQVGQHALLQVDPVRETLTEHRLVQAVLRERLSPEEQAEMARLVWKLLIVANPGRPDDSRSWEMLANINRHLRPSGIIDADDRAARGVVLDQIRFLYIRGDHVSSRELGEEAVSKWRKYPGASDEQTLIACRLLGIVRRELGLTEAARMINADTLERTRAVFGDEHEHTLVTANSYACDLRINGDYAAALELDETLYEQHKTVFGENEENTFRSAHNLAIDMRLNGRYADAHALDEDTLGRRRQVLGDRRWETWSSAGAIGRDLRALGDYAESARRLKEAIDSCQTLLSADHPEVVRMRTDYAATLRRLGQFDEAREEAEACLELNLRRLGEKHNYTLSVMTTLAEVLRLLGHLERALDLAERVVGAAPDTYGQGHTLVTASEHNYAIKLRAVGDVEAAYAIDRRVNKRFHDLLGEDRRRTNSSDISLALDFALLGDVAAARPILEGLVGRSDAVRGASHPRTLFGAMNFAQVLQDLGDDEAANALRAAALPVLRERLGARHPEVVMAEAGSFIEFELEVPDR